MTSVKNKGHYFTLDEHASGIVNAQKARRKSAFVRNAIKWFASSPVYGRERNDEGGFSGKLVKSSHGVPYPYVLVEQIEIYQEKIADLENQIQDLKNKKWWRRWTGAK